MIRSFLRSTMRDEARRRPCAPRSPVRNQPSTIAVGGGLRVVEVAGEHVVPADHDLAELAGAAAARCGPRRSRPATSTSTPQIGWPTVPALVPNHGWLTRRGRRGLGQPVALEDRGGERLLEPLEHRDRQRRAAGDAVAQLGQRGRPPAGRLEQLRRTWSARRRTASRARRCISSIAAVARRSAAAAAASRRPGRCAFIDDRLAEGVEQRQAAQHHVVAPDRVGVEGVDRRVHAPG